MDLDVQFTWDPKKDQLNQKKHGVSFTEASTVFVAGLLEVFHDPDHSHREERYIAVGFSDRSRLLLVVHCENTNGSRVRIISARKATTTERATLLRGNKA